MTIPDLATDLRYYFAQLMENAPWKTLFAAIATGFTWIFPETIQQESLLLVLMLIVLDTTSGIWSAKKNGKKLESKQFRKSISKIFLYIIIIISATLVDRVMILPLGITLAYFVNAYMALNEFGSILENLEKMGVGTPMKLIKVLKGKVSDKISNLENTDI